MSADSSKVDPVTGTPNPEPEADVTETETPGDGTKDTKGDDKDATSKDAQIARLEAAVKKANKEAEKLRHEKAAKDAEAAKANLSETEKLKAEAAELKAKLAEKDSLHRTAQIAHAVEVAAKDHLFHDPEDAMTKSVTDAIEFDEDGKIDRASVKKAVAELAKKKPHLVKDNESAAKDKPKTPGTSITRNGAPRPAMTPTIHRPARGSGI